MVADTPKTACHDLPKSKGDNKPICGDSVKVYH
jgi:hypothetical protein